MLSGATIRQLSHWRRPGTDGKPILAPEISARRSQILYSFRDVIALRTCVRLRQETSLQKIRRALGTLQDDLVIHQIVDILKPFYVRGRQIPDLLEPRPHVEVDPAVRGGEPVISGTRVPYEEVAALLRDGVTPKHVRDFYPQVSSEAARDALDFASYVDSYVTAPESVA